MTLEQLDKIVTKAEGLLNETLAMKEDCEVKLEDAARKTEFEELSDKLKKTNALEINKITKAGNQAWRWRWFAIFAFLEANAFIIWFHAKYVFGFI